MSKTKLTLSIDRDIIKEAKAQAILTDSSISDMVENFLRSMGRSWADSLREGLGIKRRYVSYDDVIKRRPKGLNAAKLVRAIRDERANSIFR